MSKAPTLWLMRLAVFYKRREFWLLVSGALLLVLLIWWLSEPFGEMMAQVGGLREWILTFGPLAPLVYIVIFALQILIAPLPGQFMGVMGGYLFGVFLGTAYSITGLMVGASLAIWLARRFGRPLLERFFDAATLATWEKKMRTRSGFTWWLLFLFPVPDVIFYAAGLSSTSLRTLLIAVIAGRGLGLFLANTMGHWTANAAPQWVLAQWVVVGILAGLIYLHQRRVRLLALVAARRMRRWSRRHSLSF
ncbi:MAG: TVP38/TMEM64 family protein [Caldilineaceae bacterium]|nr:TVP38/TMEM64 family protein [Caldilineaceae bacterium]